MSRVFPAARPVTGPNAAAMKYDILSAIGLLGVHGSARDQASMPRLILLVTARYNWRRSEVSMGQTEMARLWGVSERTAKREVKHWIERGVLICSRPGVRGRVASYQLNISRILELSEPYWATIGSDFGERMRAGEASGASDGKIVQLPVRRAMTDADASGDPWFAVKQSLTDAQPEVYSSWLADLDYERTGQGKLAVVAPSKFIASYVSRHYLDLIERTVRQIHPEIRQITVVTR